MTTSNGSPNGPPNWCGHEQVSTSEGVKAHGWVAGQNYTLTQRSMKAAEEAAANTRGL